MSSSLIDPTFLFRFEVELRKRAAKWTPKGLKLPASHRLPSFNALGDRPVFADVRMAWSADGLSVHVLVNGKRQLPWCRDSRLDDSDGFHLWIDTRCTSAIHRATQYCHRFLWMPAGGGPKRDKPLVSLVPINRARSHPKAIDPAVLRIAALPRHDGYEMSGFVPATALTGFDPVEQPRIGIYYAVIDRELGWQALALGPDYPVMEDPSLWGEAVLGDSQSVPAGRHVECHRGKGFIAAGAHHQPVDQHTRSGLIHFDHELSWRAAASEPNPESDQNDRQQNRGAQSNPCSGAGQPGLTAFGGTGTSQISLRRPFDEGG